MTNPQGKNLIFIVGSSNDRDGTNEDIEKITNIFKKSYNSEIYDWVDRSMNSFKTDPRWLEKFDQCKFVAVVYLFHGSTDDHIICNNKILAIKCHFLHPLFCIEQLNGKLKWLIAQACRGNLEGDDIDTDGDIENKFLNYYMISYCTTEGTLSYQFDNRGKIFIQYICEELANNADNDCMTSLVTMMNNVNKKIYQYGIKMDTKHFPRSEFYKNFQDYYFGLY
ncbi:uncharacterized protein LOC124419097 isoform X2 [Lucilia cuprina]|uniref:uncharacterized protein LOC124419097 isoform X2 n=1 Tax=Lucilia cuprina TaxID=7375 RepID=UPI001F067B39|nr:uncharacterized protein LOC124419097 isoform X2 [Lucilia cuprina]